MYIKLRNIFSLCLNFSSTHMKAKFRKKNLFIPTNSFIIFTCPNPVLLVPASGKWVNAKTAFYLYIILYPKFENHRRELFPNVLNYNAALLSAEDKFVWILSNEDPSCVRELAKFIHSCFQMAP